MGLKLKDAVVVITGASSGIGRATALAFAKKGSALVLSARNPESLRQVEMECRRLGSEALAVTADASREEDILRLAERAVETFGRIDVWVNNAAVTLFGRFEETPSDAYRQVLETNLFGYIHGARAAIRYFREQGRGVLINNASVYATMGAPYISAYVVSKYGIRGLGESLRQELQDVPGIQVVTLMPASIDTPIFHHAANYTGRAIKPLSPVYRPERVARAILKAARRPEREVVVGTAGGPLRLMRGLFPRSFEKRHARMIHKQHFQDRPAEPAPGNLFESKAPFGVSGAWRESEPARAGKLVLVGALLAPVLLSSGVRRALLKLAGAPLARRSLWAALKR